MEIRARRNWSKQSTSLQPTQLLDRSGYTIVPDRWWERALESSETKMDERGGAGVPAAAAVSSAKGRRRMRRKSSAPAMLPAPASSALSLCSPPPPPRVREQARPRDGVEWGEAGRSGVGGRLGPPVSAPSVCACRVRLLHSPREGGEIFFILIFSSSML